MRSLSERVAEMQAQKRAATELKARPSFTPTAQFHPPRTLEEALQRRDAAVIRSRRSKPSSPRRICATRRRASA